MLKRLGKLKEQLQDLKQRLEDVRISVPDCAVNAMLDRIIRDEEDIEAARVRVGAGDFTVLVEARKVVRVRAEVRFAIESAEITLERQEVVLRQLGRTTLAGTGLVSRIVLFVVEAVVAYLMEVDPARETLRKMDAVTVEGDRYTVDLGKVGIREVIERNEKVSALLRAGRLERILCEEGRFVASINVNVRAASKESLQLIQVFLRRRQAFDE